MFAMEDYLGSHETCSEDGSHGFDEEVLVPGREPGNEEQRSGGPAGHGADTHDPAMDAGHVVLSAKQSFGNSGGHDSLIGRSPITAHWSIDLLRLARESMHDCFSGPLTW